MRRRLKCVQKIPFLKSGEIKKSFQDGVGMVRVECVAGTRELGNQKLWLSVSDRLDKYTHHLHDQSAFLTCVIFMVRSGGYCQINKL